MYIFPSQSNDNQGYNAFMDAINILSFIIGLQNLDLNITANDIDNQTQTILDDLHGYLDKQEKHLAEQDKHLLAQDSHLLEQDMRLDRLERLIYGEDARQERRS